jgi:hypothetical protein
VENRFLGLTGSQWACVAVVAGGVATLIWFAARPKEPDGEPAPAPALTEEPSG